MLESILDFHEVDKSPYLTFVWAMLISTVGILLSTQLFYKVTIADVSFNLTGMFSVIFTIIPSVYFLTSVILQEEEMEEEACLKHYQKKFFQRHEKDIMMFLFYFLGVTFAFAIWSFVLPADFFQVQLVKIHEIRAAMSGYVTGTIVKGSFPSFMAIFLNNIEVMVFAFIFSLLFGCGAIFIIVWNASILGTCIGELSKNVFEVPMVSLSFLPHGIPEVVGYLCAGLAGGLLSAAVLRCKSSEVLRIIVFDALKIMLLGVFFILIAAGIEVYF